MYEIHIFAPQWRNEIWTQHIDQLPVGLWAQLVERCTGIAEVMQIYEFHISKIIIHHLDGLFGPNTAYSCLVSSVGRALRRYRWGHEFKSHTGLNFFQVLFSATRLSRVFSCEVLLISFVASYLILFYFKLNNCVLRKTHCYFVSS